MVCENCGMPSPNTVVVCPKCDCVLIKKAAAAKAPEAYINTKEIYIPDTRFRDALRKAGFAK